MDEDVGLGQLLEAIHSYEYEAESKDGSKRKITMHKGDRFILLRTANVEWWDVIHYDYRERPEKKFYVPGWLYFSFKKYLIIFKSKIRAAT